MARTKNILGVSFVSDELDPQWDVFALCEFLEEWTELRQMPGGPRKALEAWRRGNGIQRRQQDVQHARDKAHRIIQELNIGQYRA